MAFCNKCGAPIEATAGFCGQCGSRNAAAPMAMPASAGAGAAPARRRMGVGAKIGIGIAAGIGAIIVVLIVFGIVVAAHVHKVRLADGQTQIETPFGNARTGEPSNVTARRLGIPIYPGAEAEGSVVGSLGKMQGAVLRFRTGDSPAQVLAFYQQRYRGAAFSSEPHQVTIAENGYKLVVTAQPQDGETEIVIARGRE